MSKRPIPKVYKTAAKRLQKEDRTVKLVDGPCRSEDTFFMAGLPVGFPLRVPVPRGFDVATYVEDRLVDGVWHYRWEHE